MASRNRLHIRWNDQKTETFKGVKSEEKAMDLIFRRNIDNIIWADWADAEGKIKRLIPKTLPNEDPVKVPLAAAQGKIL